MSTRTKAEKEIDWMLDRIMRAKVMLLLAPEIDPNLATVGDVRRFNRVIKTTLAILEGTSSVGKPGT